MLDRTLGSALRKARAKLAELTEQREQLDRQIERWKAAIQGLAEMAGEIDGTVIADVPATPPAGHNGSRRPKNTIYGIITSALGSDKMGLADLQRKTNESRGTLWAALKRGQTKGLYSQDLETKQWFVVMQQAQKVNGTGVVFVGEKGEEVTTSA